MFTKNKIINKFVDELLRTIQELFEIVDLDTAGSIAINHVISNLDEEMRQEAKIFQLGGNKSLENLLEFLATKMEGNSLQPRFDAYTYGTVPLATGGVDNRLERMEKIMASLCEKVEALSKTETKRIPNNRECKKKGHTEINVSNGSNVIYVKMLVTSRNFVEKIKSGKIRPRNNPLQQLPDNVTI